MCAFYFRTPLVSLLCSHHAPEDAVASCGGDPQESVCKGHSQGGGAQNLKQRLRNMNIVSIPRAQKLCR
jgi:hypothetical protein